MGMLAFDQNLFQLIFNLSGNIYLDYIMLGISFLGSLIFWFIIPLILWLMKKKKFSMLLLFALVIDSILVYALKFGINRPRPFSGIYSFPSGHSSRVFLGAPMLSQEFPKYKIPLYILAFLVLFSRIYLGMHYPIDTIIGALIGLIIAKLVLKYKDKLI